MKKLIAVALLALLPSMATAKMPLTIGAGSTGYGATNMDKGAHFTNYWAGVKSLTVSEKTAVYATYQHLGLNGGESGHGVKALLVSGSTALPWLTLMTDVGVAFDLAAEADGSATAAFTAGGGFAVKLSEYIAPFVYASSYDAGNRFSWSIHFGMAVIDIQKIMGQ